MENHSEETLELLGNCPNCEKDVFLHTRRPHHNKRYWVVSIIIHLTLFTLVMFLINAFKHLQIPHQREQQVTGAIDHDAHLVGTTTAPLNHHEQFMMQTTDANYWNFDLYFGEPDWASDEAWNKLIYPRTFRVHPKEAERLNFTDSIRLGPDGVDSSSILGIIHNLHCLRRVRQSFYNDYYYPDASEDELSYNREHAFHCLEAIRTSILCYPDLNPYAYFWSNNKYHPVGVRSEVTRQCVDWEALGKRIESRSYEGKEMLPNTGFGFSS